MRTPPCPDCGTRHSPNSATTVSGSYFKQPPDGYQSRLGGPARPTREQAEKDYCKQQQQQERV